MEIFGLYFDDDDREINMQFICIDFRDTIYIFPVSCVGYWSLFLYLILSINKERRCVAPYLMPSAQNNVFGDCPVTAELI